MSIRSNFKNLPDADSLLRHSDVRWGLNLVHGSVQAADLDFTVPSEAGQKFTEIFTGRNLHGLHDGLLSADEANQLQVWKEERQQLREQLAQARADFDQLQRELAAENSATSGYREDRLNEIRAAEVRLKEAREQADTLQHRLQDLERKLDVAGSELADRERRQNSPIMDDGTIKAFRQQLIRLDWRIRKWRRVQQDVNNELIRQREILVSGAADSKSKVTIDLDNVRQSLFRLEQCAESLLDVVSRHSAAYKSIAPTADLNDELDSFKDQLDVVYTGLHRAHESAAREVSELTRERINWNLRALRRQRRDIAKCIKRLLKRRAELIHQMAPHCQNEHWLIEQAQNGFFLGTTDENPDHAAEHWEFKRPVDPAIAKLKELIGRLEDEQRLARERRETLRSEVEAIEQRLVSLRQDAERLGKDRIPAIQEALRATKEQVVQMETRLAKLDRLVDERDLKSRDWIHRRLSQASHFLATFSKRSYAHFAAQLGVNGRLLVKDRYGSELDYAHLPPVDRDLAALSLGLSLLDDWSRLRDHVVWNHAFDRLTTEQALEVAKAIAEHCPERLSLLVTTAHTHLADRLHAHGYHVLDWNDELPEETATESIRQAVHEPSQAYERAIILRSNNSDAEEFPGEFRDQVIRGEGHDSVYLKQEASREAYLTEDRRETKRASQEEDLVSLENELEAIRRGSVLQDIVKFNADDAAPASILKFDRKDEDINEILNRELATDAEMRWKDLYSGESAVAYRKVSVDKHEAAKPQPVANKTNVPPRTVPLDRVTKDSRLRDVGLLDGAVIARLESDGVILVRDFLTRDRTSIRRALGFQDASHAEIESWQRQLRLMCDVRKLSAFDARVLVACGVKDVGELKQLEGYELAERIESLRKTKSGQQLLRTGSDEELTKLNAWVLNMKEAKALRQFGFHDSRENGHDSRETKRDSREGRTRRTASGQTSRASSNGAKTYRLRRDSSHRETRHSDSNRERSSARRSDSQNANSNQNESLKFYLDIEDHVEAAPSIGPKMAEHLETIEISTIRDLLRRDPNEIAEQLNHRRVKPETVAAWQMQTTLVCRVPNLRGHDAQLLVACDVETAEQLAAYQAEDLFALIEPFAESREGAKIIRSGKQPDLEEVTDWIRWAQSNRELPVLV